MVALGRVLGRTTIVVFGNSAQKFHRPNKFYITLRPGIPSTRVHSFVSFVVISTNSQGLNDFDRRFGRYLNTFPRRKIGPDGLSWPSPGRGTRVCSLLDRAAP